MTPHDFLAKWQRANLSERSAYQQHFLDLCELLGQPNPAAADPEGGWYTSGGLAASIPAAGPAAVDISGAIGIRIDATTVGIDVLGTGNSTPVKLTRAGTGKDFHLAGDGLIKGGLSGAVNSVTTAVALPTGNEIYHADISLSIDNTANLDEYPVAWFKNGLPVAGTTPKISAVNRSGAALIDPDTTMVAVGSTNYFKYDSTTNRLPAGETAIVEVKATIDGATRTFVREIPRNV